MAEIRCPQCGKSNPEGRELCDFCDSPLPPSPDALFEDQDRPSPEPSHEEGAEPVQPEKPERPPQPSEAGEAGWLDILHADEEGLEAGERPPVEEEYPVGEDEVEDTDWLQRIRDLDVSKGEEAEGDEKIFPEWISEAEGEREGKVPSPPEEGDVPDWLQPAVEGEEKAPLDEGREEAREMDEGEEVEPVDVEGEPEVEEAPQPPAEEEVEGFPTWLSEEELAERAQRAEAEGEPEPEGEEVIEPFELDEEEEFIDDIFDEELPSWLTDVDVDAEEMGVEEDISPGELPGWVEAMRPVVESSDTSGLAEDEEYIEHYGPLAGIPSVLPAEPEIDQVEGEDREEHSFDLVVSKTHREYAALLEKVISQEEKVKTAPQPSTIPTQRILRWLIALLLIVAVGASIIAGAGGDFQSINPDGGGGTGAAALYDMVEGLDEKETSLLVFDYQPALAGELNAAAAGVVDHIMRQETYLSLVSTQPTGPSLGEYFLSETQTEHDYQHGRDYINLGYLPGQAAGVLSFATAPQEIIPIAFNGANAWDSPPLAEIDKLADFALILIVTDDPTTARIWIEQISPYTAKSKIGMVVSAQAEPLVRPYFENSPQQISGLVAGLPGGRSYEVTSERANLANTYWHPLNVGIIVTVLTIFIGGLANGILNLIKQHQKSTQRGGS